MRFPILSGWITGLFLSGMVLGAASAQAETGAPAITIKSLQSEGNSQVSALALQALFERHFGVWPIPDEGKEVTQDQIRGFLKAIGDFYSKRGHGGPYVCIPKESMEKEAPPVLKEGALLVSIVESRKDEVPVPAPAWMAVQGPLTERQTQERARVKAREEEERLKELEKQAEARARRESQEAAEKAPREAQEKAREKAREKALAEAKREAERRQQIAALAQAGWKEGGVFFFRPEGNRSVSTLALQALFERHFGVWPIPAKGLKISQDQLRKFLASIGEFYSQRGHGGTFVYVPREGLINEDPVALEGGILRVEIVESRAGEVPLPAPAWMAARGPLTKEQARVVAEREAREEKKQLGKVKEEDEARARRERMADIDKARLEALESARAEARARALEKAKSEAEMRAQITAKAEEERKKGGVLIHVRSFGAEGNTLVTTPAIETLFARMLLGLELPVVLRGVSRLIPAGGIYIRPDQLRRFLEEILKFYTRLGHSGVYVFVPQDSFEEGADPLTLKLRDDRLKVKVTEGRVRKIVTDYGVQKRPRPWKKLWKKSAGEAEGEEQMPQKESFAARRRRKQIAQWSPVGPGDPIVKNDLENYVDFLERQPGRTVAAVIQKSEAAASEAGEVDLQFRIRDYDPLTFYLESSNTGSETTEQLRMRLGAIHGDLTGRGDVFSLDLSSAVEATPGGNFAIYTSYDAPLWGPRWRGLLLGVYSEFKSADLLGPDTAFIGKGFILGQELSYNLWYHKDWFFDVFESIDFQKSKVKTPFDTTTEVNLFDCGFGARIARVGGNWQPSLEVKAAYNITGLLDLNNREEFSESRVETKPGYFLFSFSGNQRIQFQFAGAPEPKEDSDEAQPEARERTETTPAGKRQRLRTRLPAGNWLSVHQNFRGIYSPDRLASARQLFLGGMNTVRGYKQSEVSGDTGIYVATEPRISISNLLAKAPGAEGPKSWWEDFSVEIVPFFLDAGFIFNTEAIGGEEESLSILGIGGGGRLTYKNLFFARLYSGVAMRNAGDNVEDDTQKGDNQFNFDLTLRF